MRIGLAWYSFRKRPADAGRFGGLEAIMDVRSDPVAEWTRARIRSYRDRGKEPAQGRREPFARVAEDIRTSPPAP